jgi:polysaccharide export outer membrane protein
MLAVLAMGILGFACNNHAQAWKPFLTPERAIDWSQSGVGEIPVRPQICAHLTPAASLTEINTALHSCPRGQTVYLDAGTYAIPGTIDIPSEITLRGAGADQTILNATGTQKGYVVRMGSGSVDFHPIHILSQTGAGAKELTLADGATVHAGQYLVIAETNNPAYVSANGIKGNCNWCDGWTRNGSLARGQIVAVTAVRGNTITIEPGLYGDYTQSPIAVPFAMATTHAGVEDLQVYANNTGYDASFGMSRCAFCWIKGVESNYADGDLVEISWGYRDEVRDSYFSNAFLHKPGDHDSDIHIASKTSASRIENNIVERTRIAFELEWGSAGNVFGYNYSGGEFIADAPDAVVGGFRFHGAHPQYNLFEGNVATEIEADEVWGSASDLTAFRNWLLGTNMICPPYTGRGTIDCKTSHRGFQAARAIQISAWSTRNNFIGNLLGSATMQSLTNHGQPLAQIPFIEYPAKRSYDHAAYGWSFGYGSFSDDGSGSGCDSGGVPPCNRASTSATNLFHGNVNNMDGSTRWAKDLSRDLPASFYLDGKPSWWGTLNFPAIGPEIRGGEGPGGHSYGNPAERCYQTTMGGTDGGAGSPHHFRAALCYGEARVANLTTTVAQPEPQRVPQTQQVPELDPLPTPVAGPTLKPNPLEALKNFEPSEDEEYRLGKGDEIVVDFAGRPEMQTRLIVGPDGRITLPLAGELMLAGRSRSEASRLIASSLEKYYAHLDVQVTVSKYTANRVIVLGAVAQPGVVNFDGTPTLLEALTRSGLASDTKKTHALPERCAVYRGREQVVWVDLKALIDSGNPLADLRLRRDDVIYVPSGTDRFISVLGEVQHPGAVQLLNSSTLASVLADAGGFTEKAGNTPHIQIVDPQSGASRTLSFRDVLNPAKSQEITLRSGEIIFVPQSGFSHATYYLQRLSPIFQLSSLSYLVRDW